MQRTSTSPSQIAFFEPLSWWTPIGFSLFAAFGAAVGCFWYCGFFHGLQDLRADGPWAWALLIFLLVVVGSQVWRFFETGIKWFGRMGACVDRQAGTVDTYWGILFPLPWSQRPLDAFEQLVLGKEITEYTTRHGTRIEIEYQLYLASGSAEPLLVGRSDDYGPVRIMAEQLGEFLKFDVIDASGLTTELLPCGTLCRPAWERDRAALAAYQPPADYGPLKYRVEGKTLHVECPATGSLGCLLAAVIPLGLLAWLLTYIYLDSQGKAWIPMLLIGGIGSLVILTIFSLFLPSTSAASASPSGLTLLDTGLFGTNRTEVPADTIWQLRSDFSGVSIVTSEGLFALPTSEAGGEEAERLRVRLLFFLAGGR